MPWARVWLLILLAGAFVQTCAGANAADKPRTAIDIGSDRQLFVDHYLIEKLTNCRLALHRPTRREIVIRNDNPWEKFGVSYLCTFRDGDRFRAWYRCDAASFEGARKRNSMTAYAESSDGIHWKKPKLGIINFGGSKDNNLIWTGPGANMAVFKDGNPQAPADERYKAIVRTRDVFGLVSADGLHWRLAKPEPILTDRPFDSHNIAFWDTNRNEYVAYTRGVVKPNERKRLGAGMKRIFFGGVRAVRRSTSKDFRNWLPLQPIDTGDAPLEQLYTNATIQYPRSPGLYLMFPSRFADARKPVPNWKYDGVNDIVLLSSRDGLRFHRTFMEAFVRPGLDRGNWHDRALYMERGILQTSPNELSMYAMENWRLDTVHIRRLTLRPDGFASVHAGYSSGELLTRPFKFSGKSLLMNYSTAASGSIRVEIQTVNGAGIPGYTLADCPEIFGDELDDDVTWKKNSDVSELNNQVIRLRFVLRDADLYAIQFAE